MNQQAESPTPPHRRVSGILRDRLIWMGMALLVVLALTLAILPRESNPAPTAPAITGAATPTGAAPSNTAVAASSLELATPAPLSTTGSGTKPQVGTNATAPPTPAYTSVTTSPASVQTRTSTPPVASSLPLAGSDLGTWRITQDGNTTYQLPEGASEGEALGQLTHASNAPISVQIASSGDDCGLALGDAQRFVLLRLRSDGQSEVDVLLDEWQGDNFTTPPPTSPLTVKNAASGTWHTVTLAQTGTTITYTVDGQSGTVATDLPPGSGAYLYAGGSGCEYRTTPTIGGLAMQDSPKRTRNPWRWFEAGIYGGVPQRLSGSQKLKMLLITCALGVILGIFMITSGAAGFILSEGMKQAGYQSGAAPASAPTDDTAPQSGITVTISPIPQRGGWVTPIAP